MLHEGKGDKVDSISETRMRWFDTTIVKEPYQEEYAGVVVTRVGAQPRAFHPFVSSGSLERVLSSHTAKIKTLLLRHFKEKPEKESFVVQHMAEIRASLIQEQQRSGFVSQICNFSGTKLSMAPGPRAASTDAFYPISMDTEGKAWDHYSGVCTGQVSLALNLAKGSGAILDLVIAAAWINTKESNKSLKEKVFLKGDIASILC